MAGAGLTAAASVFLALVLAGSPAWPADWAPPAARSAAALHQGAPRGRIAFLFLVDRVSFEELLSVPEFRLLAAHGGAALVVAAGTEGRSSDQAWRVVGAGSGAGDADPAALAVALQERGALVCPAGGAGSAERPFHPERVLAGLRGTTGPPPCAGPAAERQDPSFPAGVRTDAPALSAFARDVASRLGGPGPSILMVVDLGDTTRVDAEAPYSTPIATTAHRHLALVQAGRTVRSMVEAMSGSQVMVLVATPGRSFDMERTGDLVTPVVLAEGPAVSLFDPGPPRSLRSASTRLDGVVADVDVAPTILDFFDVPAPSEMTGQPMEPAGGEPPFSMHRRHLDHRRVRFPLQLGAAAFVVLVCLVQVLALVWVTPGRPLRPRSTATIRFLALCTMTLVLAMLAGGLLPRPTYGWAVPFLIGATVGLVALCLWAGRGRTLGAFLALGAVGTAFLVLDAVMGGPAVRLPLLGGTAFDGGRFYGLPNAFIALLLAGTVFLAAWTTRVRGVALLAVAGLFAGFPGLGANVGASITLFVAAGLWWVARGDRGHPVRDVAFVAGITALGLAAVLAANRFLPGADTHATRFVETTGGNGFSYVVETVRRRLSVGAHQLAEAPVGLVPLAMLPLLLGLALRPPAAIARGLTVRPRWREVVVVIAGASMAAYLANDSGVAAAGPGMVYALAAMAYPTLVVAGSRWRRRSRP